jgi:hypothetical protein
MLRKDLGQNPFSTVSVKFRNRSDVRCTTALAPKAEVHPRSCDVAEVPKGEIPLQQIFYSITSSARASRVGGMVSPIALAVLRLITSSNLID